MTMFRDEHKPRVQRRRNVRFLQPFQAQAIKVEPAVPIDMMTGRTEQADDWPTAETDSSVLLVAAKAIVMAAATSSVLGIGILAPRVGESPAVQMAPNIMPRGKS